MAETPVRWQLDGDYFENCSCDVICPCLFSPNPPLTVKPTAGHCEVMFAIHIDRGAYGPTSIDGLNVAMIGRTPGAMGEGGMVVALYMDDRATPQQQEALGAIFSGQAGGPVSAFGPLITKVLGAKTASITFAKEGKRRSVTIPGIMNAAVQAIPSMRADGGEVWTTSGHPFAPDALALAVAEPGTTFSDYDMSWDNSGKNGHYAPIHWSNA